MGDIDGDGYADVVESDAHGYINVVYGHATPFPALVDIDTLTSCQGFTITENPSTGGTSLAMGDVNGDGIADLVIGDLTTSKLYVVFGKAKTCPGTPTFSDFNANNLTPGTAPKGVIIKGGSGDFGDSLAIGNLTGAKNGANPINDIIAGDYLYNSSKGRVFVIAGQTTWPAVTNASPLLVSGLTGIPAAGACTAASSTCGFVIKGAGANEMLGLGFSMGDITGHGNGISDLVITGGQYVPTIAEVVRGSASAWAASYNDTAAFPSGTAFVFTTNTAWYGGVTAIADVNKDGNLDLLIGDDQYNTSNGNGAVFVVYGPLTASRNFDTTPLTGADGFRLDCETDATSSCATDIAVLDINGDGYPDIFVGDPQNNVGGLSGAGYAFVLYGKAAAFSTPYALSLIHK